jgi:hypothetical protein
MTSPDDADAPPRKPGRNLTGTIGLIVSIGTLVAVGCNVYLTRSALITSNRAWLIPTGASFFEPIAEHSRVKINLENIGKMPALNVRQIDETPETRQFTRLPSGVPDIDSENIKWPTQSLCDSKERKFEPIGPVYPSEKTHYMRHMARGNADDLGARAFIVIFHGCFLYGDAFGERTSPYCFYSVPASDKTTNPQDWTFAPCLLRTESPT